MWGRGCSSAGPLVSLLSGRAGGTSGSPESESGSAVGLSFTSSGFGGLLAGALLRAAGDIGRAGFLKSSSSSGEARNSLSQARDGDHLSCRMAQGGRMGDTFEGL